MSLTIKSIALNQIAFKGLSVIDGKSEKTSATQDGEIISHLNGIINNLNRADIIKLSDPDGTLKDDSIHNISVKITGKAGKHLKKYFDAICKVVKNEMVKDKNSKDAFVVDNNLFEAEVTNENINFSYATKDNPDKKFSWKFDANENPDHWNLPFVIEDLKWALIVFYKRHFKD